MLWLVMIIPTLSTTLRNSPRISLLKIPIDLNPPEPSMTPPTLYLCYGVFEFISADHTFHEPSRILLILSTLGLVFSRSLIAHPWHSHPLGSQWISAGLSQLGLAQVGSSIEWAGGTSFF